MLPDINLDRILDPSARALTVPLLNVVEALSAEVRLLREENNRLTGKQGQPEILPQVQSAARRTNHSSEQDRRTMPADALGRGYADALVWPHAEEPGLELVLRRSTGQGLASSPWPHLDDTPTRVNGHNKHCHVTGNPLYTAYHTTPSKDWLSVLDVLRNPQTHTFRLNAQAPGSLYNVSAQ
jgi:hypothetical protein